MKKKYFVMEEEEEVERHIILIQEVTNSMLSEIDALLEMLDITKVKCYRCREFMLVNRQSNKKVGNIVKCDRCKRWFCAKHIGSMKMCHNCFDKEFPNL